MNKHDFFTFDNSKKRKSRGSSNGRSLKSSVLEDSKLKDAIKYTDSMIDSYQRSVHKTMLYYVIYSALFVGICLTAFSWFYLNDRSFIWKPDGIDQHFNALMYYGQWLRNTVAALGSGGKSFVSLWDFSIGYGSDIITSLHYYVIGDPLCLLSFFVSKEHTEILYHVLIILRIYLAGLSFSMYCHRVKADDFSTLVGSMTYAFCMYSVYYGIRHPYFLNPLIYLPLLLIGVEKIFHKEKPYFFIIMTFLATVSNFYFFYMLSIFIFLYSVIRFFHLYKRDIMKNMLTLLGKCIAFYLVGVAMACFIFFPIVIAFFSSNRVTTENLVPIVYSIRYYQSLLPAFFSAATLDYGTILGFFSVSFLSIILLFAKRKKNWQLIIGFCILVSFLLIPYAGHVLNGFSYIGNRWVFALIFLIAFIVVKMMPTLLNINIRASAILFFCTTIYFFLCFLMANSRKETLIFSLALTFMLLFLLVFSKILRREKGVPGQKILFFTKLGVVLITTVSILSTCLYRYSAVQGNYISEFIEAGDAKSKLSDYSTKVLDKIADTDFYRYDDRTEGNNASNTALLNGKNSIGYYFSLENGNISNFLSETGSTPRTFQRYSGLDNRMLLEALASVKYAIIKRGTESQLSSGFTKLVASSTDEDGVIYDLYYNQNSLPIGYTYSSYITKDRFLTLSLAKRQEALAQGVVVEEESDALQQFSQTSFNFTDLELPFDVEIDASQKDNIEVQDGKIIVRKANSQLKLKLEQTMDRCETYVIFNNLKFSAYTPRETYSDEEWEKLDVLSQNNVLRESKFYEEPSTARVQVKSGSVSKAFTISTKTDPYYIDRENCLVNLCYNQNPRSEVTLTFDTAGEYTFDNLQVVAQSLSVPKASIDKLRENTLENVSIGTNTVSGTISLNEVKILCLSIPYSNGWHAKVDGVETDILKANTMYMCIPLTAGNHTIELNYSTPGLSIGATLTKIGFFLLICMLLYDYVVPRVLPELQLKKNKSGSTKGASPGQDGRLDAKATMQHVSDTLGICFKKLKAVLKNIRKNIRKNGKNMSSKK